MEQEQVKLWHLIMFLLLLKKESLFQLLEQVVVVKVHFYI